MAPHAREGIGKSAQFHGSRTTWLGTVEIRKRDGMKREARRRKWAGSYLRAEEAGEAPAGETE